MPIRRNRHRDEGDDASDHLGMPAAGFSMMPIGHLSELLARLDSKRAPRRRVPFEAAS
jgi:hypothetical protein